MIQFYLPEISMHMTELPETESGHCVRVLRMKCGDEIVCVDGKGTRYKCKIVDAHPKHCGIEVVESELDTTHWGCRITLCFAPTKNMDRVEWMAEKCTELGIDRFIPVECRFSERRVLKTDRLNKILISAMKQSLKSTLPMLDELTPVQNVLVNLTNDNGTPFTGKKFIAYCADTVERHEFVKEYAAGEDVAILIGPEGDFSPQEVQTAFDNGWIPVSLGASRLRAETAAVVAIADVHCINQLNQTK
ncbi:MAG: 16S rRNA (uracil(1498)-N(3))-methyltransferase [Prevotella sp.]|nr:16S rRNA (uracil(1498)-N(3))-methyltransferase [Prevotella sp.]MCM1075227.1 16S rRNA (uracil(1498)-N(3))-methyltransferase [Ruminococcus sp.]